MRLGSVAVDNVGVPPTREARQLPDSPDCAMNLADMGSHVNEARRNSQVGNAADQRTWPQDCHSRLDLGPAHGFQEAEQGHLSPAKLSGRLDQQDPQRTHRYRPTSTPACMRPHLVVDWGPSDAGTSWASDTAMPLRNQSGMAAMASS